MPCTALSTPRTRWSKYCPNLGAAAFFTALYAITTIVHVWQAVKYGKKRLCWPLIMGGVWETGGFVTRSLAIIYPTSEPLFDTQYALVLMSPLWINAFAYVLLGRLVYFYLPFRKLCGLRTWAFGAIFVFCDIAAFAVQVIGVLFTLSTDLPTQNMGLQIYSIGTGVQQFFICIFALLTWRFIFEVKRDASIPRGWDSARPLVRMLVIVLGLISFRVLFRLVEFSGGVYSSLTSHIQSSEAYQYIFDSTLMLFAMIVVHHPHPGTILTGEDSEPPRGNARRAIRKARKLERKQAKESKKAAKARRGSVSAYTSDIELGPYSKLQEFEVSRDGGM